MTQPFDSAAPPAATSASAPAAEAPVPFGTPGAPRVAVRGEARLEFDPETAGIGVTVSARGTDRRAALEALTRRNAQVLELLRGYGEAVEKVATGAFSVTPEVAEKGRRERVRTYQGRVRVSATVTDFTALGELTTRLAELELTRVDGPRWGLRPDSAAYRDARQQAVREAVTRAREYAEALGSRLVTLVELADPGAESEPVPPAPGVVRAAFTGAGHEREEVPALDLEPQQQTVQAQVTARFVMTPPEL